jgi:hypothetical protein
MGVGDKAGQEIDGEVGRITMTGVLDLRNVLELIGDRLDTR